MKSKRWIIATILTGLLTVALAGGVIYAQGNGDGEGDENDADGGQSFASRVAGILGLDETAVQDAMDQAKGEMIEDALKAKMDELVESGKITREQADEYVTWFQNRPEGIGEGFERHGRGHHGGPDRDSEGHGGLDRDSEGHGGPDRDWEGHGGPEATDTDDMTGA